MGLMWEFGRILDIEQIGSKVVASPNWQKAKDSGKRIDDIIYWAIREYYGEGVDMSSKTLKSLVKNVKKHIGNAIITH